MKKTFYRITALSIVILFTNGCYNDNAEFLYGNQNSDCSTVQAKFGTDVSQIINSKCAVPGCHNAGAAGNPAGITLQTYLQVSSSKDRINTRVVVDKTMPPSGPLTPDEISKIKCWIAGGAPNN